MNTTPLTAEAEAATIASIRRVVKARTEVHARNLTGGNAEALTDSTMVKAFELAVVEVADRYAAKSGRPFRNAVDIIRLAFAA